MSDIDVDAWWHTLRTTALVGTARRDLDPLPALGVSEAAASREQRLLVAAALADVVRRAGRRPASSRERGSPAPAQSEPPAPEPAQQLLTLLLVQPPVSAHHRLGLVEIWLDCAVSNGYVVPTALLTAVLDGLTEAQFLHPLARRAVGPRGQWLATLNPAWEWATGTSTSTGMREDLEHLSPSERAVQLASMRDADPGAALEAVRATWATDSAQVRAANVEIMAIGLSEADGDFLESCLDDRAKSVRSVAQRLLDGLPGSSRAARQARRLQQLLRVEGTLRRTLHVQLPDDPDAAAARDGLIDPGPQHSRRAYWLQRVIEGAPMQVWTAATGVDAARTLSMLRGEHVDVVRVAMRNAARRQHDHAWARALLDEEFDTSLLEVLPADERASVMLGHLRRTPITVAADALTRVEQPWGPELSAAVVKALRREKDVGHAVRILRDVLVSGLDPSVLSTVESWLRTLGPDGDRVLRSVLRDVLQYQSLSTSIREALS